MGRPDFARLWGSGLVSDIGDWMLLVSLPVFVFNLTGSALITSTVFVVELVPALIVGQLAGVLVDRWDRRRILLVSGIVQAVLLLPLLAVTTTSTLWIVYLVAAVQSCLARLCAPAKAALVPSLVEPDELPAANSLSAVADNLARLVGSPLGGVVVQLFGLVGVVVIDAATFLASSGLVAGIRHRPERASAGDPPRPSLLRDWLDGLRTIRRTPPLPAVVSIAALAQVAQGIFVVLFVVFVLERLGGGGGEVGLLRGVQAVGGVIGGLIIGVLVRRFDARSLVGWGYLAFGLISLATWNGTHLTTAIALYVGLFVAAGVPGVATMTGLVTTIQAATPQAHLGRVYAAFETAAGGLQAVGVLIAGALADRVGLGAILNTQGAIYLLCGVLALVWLQPARRVAPVRAAVGQDRRAEAG